MHVCVFKDMYINGQINDSYCPLWLVTFWPGVWLTGGLWVMAFCISDKALLGVVSGVLDAWMALPGWVRFSAERKLPGVIMWCALNGLNIHKRKHFKKQGNCYRTCRGNPPAVGLILRCPALPFALSAARPLLLFSSLAWLRWRPPDVATVVADIATHHQLVTVERHRSNAELGYRGFVSNCPMMTPIASSCYGHLRMRIRTLTSTTVLWRSLYIERTFCCRKWALKHILRSSKSKSKNRLRENIKSLCGTLFFAFWFRYMDKTLQCKWTLLPMKWWCNFKLSFFSYPVKLNANRVVTGILRGFDPYMNLVLDEAVEERSSNQKYKIGMVVRKWHSIT